MSLPNRLFFLVISLAFVLPGDINSTVASSFTVRGTIALTYLDHFSSPELSRELITIVTVDGAAIPVVIPQEILEAAGGIMDLQFKVLELELSGHSADTVERRVEGIRVAVPDERWYDVDPHGNMTWVNLLCRIPDVSLPDYGKARIKTIFGDVYPGLADYWLATSHGATTLSSSTYDWKSLPRTLSEYKALSIGTRLEQTFSDCAHIHGVSTSGSIAVNMFFNAAVFDGYSVGGYRYSGGHLQRRTWIALGPLYQPSPALIAHEMGHAYGLPHSNNNDGVANDPYDNPWDIMSSSYSGNHDLTYGFHAPPTNSYYYQKLGFISPENRFVLSSGSRAEITIDTWAKLPTDNLYIATVPIPGSSVFYTVETRKKSYGGYDSNIIGDGVLIYEIDNSRTEPAWMILDTGTQAYNPDYALTVGEIYGNLPRKVFIRVKSETPAGYVVQVSQGVYLDDIAGVYPAADQEVVDPIVEFLWSAVETAIKYRLKLRSADRSQSTKIQTDDTVCDMGLCSILLDPENLEWKWRDRTEYRWNVRATGSQGITLAKSHSLTFRVEMLPEQLAIIEPIDGSVMTTNAPTFYWSHVDLLDEYRVKLKSAAGFVYKSEWLSASTICLSDCGLQLLESLDAGTYVWKVKGRRSYVSGSTKSVNAGFTLSD